jgi:hypothetical protein
MRRFIKTVLIVFVLLIGFFVTLGEYQDYIYRHGSYYKSQWINSHKNQKFDAVIIGNSHASVLELDSGDVRYLNLAEDGIGIKLTYLQLYQFFKNGNQAEFVLMEADVHSLRRVDEKKRSPRWLPYFNDSIIYSVLNDEFPSFKYHKYFPALNYLIFKYDWGIASLLNNIFDIKKSPWGKYGYLNNCDPYVNSSNKGSVDFQKYPPNWDWIERINKTCEENDARLLIFTSPYCYMDDTISNTRMFSNKLETYDIGYVDFSRLYLSEKSFFRDNSHLNCLGVEDFKKNLHKLLK